MRVWRVSWMRAIKGRQYSWHGSNREATDKFNECKLDPSDDIIDKQVIEIPTKKSGLIDWLNSHLHTDNG